MIRASAAIRLKGRKQSAVGLLTWRTSHRDAKFQRLVILSLFEIPAFFPEEIKPISNIKIRFEV